MPMSRYKNVSEVNSVVMKAINLYSAFELDRTTVDCFLEHHEMQFSHKKTQKLVVLRCVKGHLA